MTTYDRLARATGAAAVPPKNAFATSSAMSATSRTSVLRGAALPSIAFFSLSALGGLGRVHFARGRGALRGGTRERWRRKVAKS